MRWLLVTVLVLCSGFFGLAGLALLLGWDGWVIGLASFACSAGAAVSSVGTARRRAWGATSALVFGGLTAVFMVGADLLYVMWRTLSSSEKSVTGDGGYWAPHWTAIIAADPVTWACLGAGTVLPLLSAALALVVILRGQRSSAQA